MLVKLYRIIIFNDKGIVIKERYKSLQLRYSRIIFAWLFAAPADIQNSFCISRISAKLLIKRCVKVFGPFACKRSCGRYRRAAAVFGAPDQHLADTRDRCLIRIDFLVLRNSWTAHPTGIYVRHCHQFFGLYPHLNSRPVSHLSNLKYVRKTGRFEHINW